MPKTSRQKFEKYRQDLGNREDSQETKRSKPETRSAGALVAAFWKLLEGQRGAVVFALATLTIATVLGLLPPLATKLVIDVVLGDAPPPEYLVYWPSNPFQQILTLGAAVIGVSFLSVAIKLWGRWQATLAVNRLQASLRKKTFEHAVQLPLHRVYELKSGGAASLLREDAGGASELVFNLIYNPWQAVVQLLGSLLVLVMIDWRMMLGGVLLAPLVWLTHRTWINRIRPMYRDVRSQRQRIDSHTVETFGGMRIVRGFAQEPAEAGRYVGSNNLLIRQQLFVWWWARLVDVVWSVLIPLASTAMLVYGGYQILQGQMTLGDLMMFLFYLAMLLEPLAVLASSATSFQNNLAGLDRVLDVLDEPAEMQPRPDAVEIDPAQTAGRIRLENVGFTYPNSQRSILSGIDFEAAPGETIALVGRSGAGKTTLCNLIARFYDPTTGSVQLDGRDLRDLTVGSYRRLLGVVEQDVFLFDGSIRENIAYAVRSATQEQIEEAAQSANAHDFILQLENGYDTIIGERGVKLSGGQRQRLAIARAILADPRILILDEATSNLDSESELAIHESLQTLMQGRTCFVIAHRMSTITLADRIIVLEDGRITEMGNHDELMQISGHYRRMVELQTLGEEVP
ncbi:ABC transporter ATP-binding protein [Lignipirellula cremea]|uniref:Multidrug export ATP-binding/permease protein n=1 Tax=Lignipirellula cremea TaxID=2528010 RepID=A0A518DN93_9BACT|nr:ABC transporter ATP-binding protein [Lignipirellula cremea]QDU93308.1 Putative multidrug export ATP-binding/permease protein [Lignipirellula cremea]